MMFINRIRQYRVYRRLLLSYLLLSVITISVLSIILYSFFSSRAVQEVDKSSMEMLTQVSYTSNVVYEQVRIITGQLLTDHEIMSFLYAKEDDKMVNYTASLFLTRIQSVYPFIENLSLYNYVTDSVVDLKGLPMDPDLLRQDEISNIDFYPRTVTAIEGKPLRLLTFKFTPERSFSQIPKSAIVFDLNEDYIRNTMRSIGGSSREADTFIMDATGRILSHSNPSNFKADYSRNDYVKRIVADTRNQGSFVTHIDRQKQLITYVKSANLDWYFVSVRPYVEMISNINELRDWTIVIALLLIVVGIGISLMLSGNIYNPIRALVDKVKTNTNPSDAKWPREDEYEVLSHAFDHEIERAKSMEMTLNRSSRALKDSYISHLLKGISRKMDISSEMKREWESWLEGPYLTVILFKIDGYPAFKEQHNAFDRGLYRFAISNIAQDILGKSYRVVGANMEEDEIALIVKFHEEERKDNLFLMLGEIQDTTLRYYKISLSVGIGITSESLGEISASYKSAQEALKARLFLDHGCMADAATRQEEEEKPDRYPVAIEKRLIEAIKLGNRATIKAEIAEFRAALSIGSYKNAMSSMNFIVLSLLREFEYVKEWWGVDVDQLDRTMDRIRDIETLNDTERLLSTLCERIVNILEEHTKNTTVSKNARIVEEIQQYVDEHFSEHSLSLEAVADRFGYSSGYIGKLFKSMTGTTFNDYVTHTRMERAKELIATIDDSIANIGERVGVYNVPYFTTLFKKKYGITPSQYREQMTR